MSARTRVADFWDDVLAQWMDGQRDLRGPLKEWAARYRGTGRGEVDLTHYPDPYVGDLRGIRSDPKFVFLGLNPGVGFDYLQGPDGLWSKRIAETGLSRCFKRSPAEDPDAWIKLHGKPSRYWLNVIQFAQRWQMNASISANDILNLELYPWHSIGLTAQIEPPAHIVSEFVFAPLEEVGVDTIFAFGTAWFGICEGLASQGSVAIERPASLVPGWNRSNWRVGIYQLPSQQRIVVSSQSGYAGPPGPARIETLRDIVGNKLPR